jgi:hypothetical protein
MLSSATASLLLVLRTYVFIHGSMQHNFRNQVPINAISIAMWNKNKAIMTLAIIVSGIIVAFHLHSKSLPLNPRKDLKSHINVDWQQISHG